LQHIANLPHTFTYDKNVMKLHYACMQCTIKVEVSRTTTILPK
jgi:hypothetical protein